MTTSEFNLSVVKASKSLKPFAMRLTRDYDDANDLLQDTMVKAFVHRDKFSDGTNLTAWMYTIMKNTFITNYQRLLKKKTFIDTSDNLFFINSSESLEENRAEGKLMMEDIQQALKKVDDTFKVPFMMYYKGYKYQEIAEQLNIPIGTVKNRIHLCRSELKNSLKTYRN